MTKAKTVEAVRERERERELYFTNIECSLFEEIKLRMQNKIDKLKVNKRNNVNSVSCDNSSFINISRDNNSISV